MEDKATWEDVPEDIVVTISIAKGRRVLRNEVRIPLGDILPLPPAEMHDKPHMLLAKYMEDYFYPMAQKFCDRVFTPTASRHKE